MNKKLSKNSKYLLSFSLDEIKKNSRLMKTFNKKFEDNKMIFKMLSKVTMKKPYCKAVFSDTKKSNNGTFCRYAEFNYRYCIADNYMFTMFTYPYQSNFKNDYIIFRLIRDDYPRISCLTKDGFPNDVWLHVINHEDFYFVAVCFDRKQISLALSKKRLGKTFSEQLFNIFCIACYETQKAFLKELKKED